MLGQEDRTLVQGLYNPDLTDGVEFAALATRKNGWFHLRMEIHFDTGVVATLIDGVVAGLSMAGAKVNAPAFVALSLGVFMQPSPDTSQVFFDNVVVQKLP